MGRSRQAHFQSIKLEQVLGLLSSGHQFESPQGHWDEYPIVNFRALYD